MSAEGTGVTNLTQHPALDSHAAWSPDRGRIAFESDRDGNLEVYVMNADGTVPLNLTRHPAEDGRPAWSPDGSKIAFTTDRDGNREIYVMSAEGTGLVNLSQNPGSDQDPAWSSDGSRIAFRSSRNGLGPHIFVMNADGSGQIRVTAGVDPSWSPDGNRLAYAGVDGPDIDINVIGADGTNRVRLTTNDFHDAEPAWSPDGSRIAFVSDRSAPTPRIGGSRTHFEIYVMRADGTDVRRLTNDMALDGHPAWKPR